MEAYTRKEFIKKKMGWNYFYDDKMSIFAKIEKRYNWKIISKPVALSGGFMHKMYRIDTQQGVFALKLLNPFVMQRKNAMDNFSKAEQIEFLVEQHGVPILPALSFGGRKMQEIDGQYFYLFDYFPGKSLQSNEITAYHCKEMGKVLAKIHGIDKRYKDEVFYEMSIDWNFYLAKMKNIDTKLYIMLKDALPVIQDTQNKGNQARKKLPLVIAICHNDMDCKNVLWKGNDYRIIDLECLSYNNPFMELFELALCWSGYEDCKINFQLFESFLQGYKNADGNMPVDWETLYDCNNGRLEWLEYNIKRVLGIDCGADEKEIGMKQVEETLHHIIYYFNMKNQILEHCKKR